MMSSVHTKTGNTRPPSPQEPCDRWLRAAIAAADALANLHQSGIIHQNIRPQTLRVDLEGELVELTGAELSQLSEPSALKLPLDALPYIAPEQTGRLEGPTDQRADLYSLGIVLYELRAGTLPFHADDPAGWVHCHIARAPRPLVEVAPDTPVIVADIVMRLLAKSPDDRYQSARGLRHDLQKCLSDLDAYGQIEPFPLGARDVWDKLRAAGRMYGRTEELAALRGAVESVRATGACELVLISGPSGIGKSALVRELQRELGSGRACFLQGKFEKHKRDIPYAPLGHTFQDLIRQTMALADAELAAVRQQLQRALGDNAQLVMDVVPQLDLVLGKQPAVAPLPGAEARHRFHLMFRNFLGVFATRERPLVLFLDDLQWADFASLELMQHIVTHPDVQNLLVIGACRDDEADLSAMVSEIQGAGATVTSIALGPLPHAALVALVVDVFRCMPDEAKPLASLLWAKANGNPFFAVQLLSALHHEQLIHFDARKWAWQWDLAELEAKGITNDMVELVLGKLQRLPKRTLNVLKLAACIGSEFSVHLLSTLCRETPDEVRSALEPALMDGLLLQRPQGYKFLHDRVLQAAYSLIPEDERPDLHLQLGWLLLQCTPDAAIEGVLFDIVNQLNLGAERVTVPDERHRIAELNLRAGRKAKAASATKSAVTYLSTGLSLLSSGGWETGYSLAYGLHLELAECEFLGGRFEEAEQLCALLVERARTRVEKAAAYRLQIHLATAQVDNMRGVQIGLSCLRLFGIDLPASPSQDDLVTEITWVRNRVRDRAIEALIDLPEMTDPDMVAAMGILAAIYPASLYVMPTLTQIATTRMVRLSILHGNTPASVHGYVILGDTLCARFGEFHDAYRFGKLGWDLGQRPGFGSYSPEAAVHFGAMTLVWARPLREALDLFRTGFRVGRDSGKLLYAGSNLLQNVMALLALGEPLDAVYEAAVTTLEFVTAAKYAFLADCAVGFQRFIHTLRNNTERLGSFSGDGFDEEAFETHLRERSIPLVRFLYYVYKLIARYWARDYDGAHSAAKEAEALLWSGLNTITEAERRFYVALTAAALCESAGQAERVKLQSELASHQDQLRRWAESCPESFTCRHALVSAEIARVDGRDHDAATLYNQAIRASRDAALVQVEGLACELAGRFFLSRDFDVLPGAYFRKARACYARWGAVGKVHQLEAFHADLLDEPPSKTEPPVPAATAEPIDTLIAAKASAAISSEMSPDELLVTLMKILIEHAGAQRACLFLPSQRGFSVAADITSDTDGVRVAIPEVGRPALPAEFPLSVAHYVHRTRDKLIFDDMPLESTFTADPYLASTRPKSLLCAPIVRRGEVAGILYLENTLVRGAFTSRRLTLLQFLSAISLEIALLAADLVRQTAERTQAEKTLRQSEERLQRLVETANVVPWEADRATGRFTYVGPQVVKMLGYPQQAWLAEDFLRTHVHPDDRETTLRSLVAPPTDDDFDFRVTAADGRTLWLHNVVSAQDVGGADIVGGFFFDVTERKQAEVTLKEKLHIIEEQQTAIRKLSTPIIEVWEGVLTMPVLGMLDEQRAEQMMTVVLDAVSRSACRYTIIDLTGVDSVDTKTADHIMRIVRAIQLLGAQCIVVGIRSEVAQTIVSMGIHLSSTTTLANLREALLLCMRDQGRRPIRS